MPPWRAMMARPWRRSTARTRRHFGARDTQGNYAARWSAQTYVRQHGSLRYDAADRRVMVVGNGRQGRVDAFDARNGAKCFDVISTTEPDESELIDAAFVGTSGELAMAELFQEYGRATFTRWHFTPEATATAVGDSWRRRQDSRPLGLTDDGRHFLAGGYAADASSIEVVDTKTGKPAAALEFPAGGAVSGWAAEALLQTAVEIVPRGDGRIQARLRHGATVELTFGPDRAAKILLDADGHELVSPKSGEFTNVTVVALEREREISGDRRA